MDGLHKTRWQPQIPILVLINGDCLRIQVSISLRVKCYDKVVTRYIVCLFGLLEQLGL